MTLRSEKEKENFPYESLISKELILNTYLCVYFIRQYIIEYDNHVQELSLFYNEKTLIFRKFDKI